MQGRRRYLPGIWAADVQHEALQLRAAIAQGGAQLVSVNGGAARRDRTLVFSHGRRPVEQRRVARQVQGLRA